jgi:hypothetical protein
MGDKLKVDARARVQVTIEVTTEVWGEDCSIGQLYAQAAESGINQIHKLVAESKMQARVVGEPKVIAVLAEKT